MNELVLALKGGWNVLSAGLVFGAGLPVVFALAVRCLALGEDRVGADGTRTFAPSPLGRVLAVLLFLVLAAAVATGITLIVAAGLGKVVDFSHVVPMIVDKKK